MGQAISQFFIKLAHRILGRGIEVDGIAESDRYSPWFLFLFMGMLTVIVLGPACVLFYRLAKKNTNWKPLKTEKSGETWPFA